MSGRAGALGAMLFVCALVATTAHAQTTAAITADDLRLRLSMFAADSMQGRALGSRGLVKATEYVAKELARLKLKPAGDPVSFFQKVPIARVKIDLETAELLTGRVTLKPGVDFLPILGHFGVSGPPTVARTGLSRLHFLGNMNAPLELAVVQSLRDDTIPPIPVLLPPTRADGRPDFQIWNSAGVLQQFAGATAVFVETLDLTPASIAAALASSGYMLRSDEEYLTFGSSLLKPDTLRRVPPLVAITRSAVGFLRLAPSGFAYLKYSSETSTPSGGTPRNVVAMIEGSDLALRSEVVVLSAHLDHLGIVAGAARSGRDSIMNGADVGGSGAMALLEIAEQMIDGREKPKRSIVFLWTTAAEQGMLGAQWFMSHAIHDANKTPEKKGGWLGTVVANINVDAIGRGSATDIERGGPTFVQVIGANVPSKAIAKAVDRAIKRPEIGLHVDDHFEGSPLSTRSSCGGDHSIFARFGVPSVLVTTGDHADAREVSDAPDRIDYDKYAKVTRFVAGLAMELGLASEAIDVGARGPC